jgi:hypothetical protein
VGVLIAKLGIERIRAVDIDIVAPENLGPSLYGWPQVDGTHPIRKVDALAEMIQRDAHRSIIAHYGDVRELERFGDVVFLCVDSNDLKKEMVERFSTMQEGYPAWVFEGRMSERHLMVHSFDPRNELHLDAWMRYCLPDSEVDGSRACGAAPVSIGATALLAASLLEQLFIDYLQKSAGRRNVLVNQVYVDLESYEMLPARWG